jgi:predicted acyltransferase
VIFLFGGARAAAVSAAALLLGYWAFMGAFPLDPEGNLAARIDHAVFGVHTWKPGWDPEGLLSTLPAIATTLLGVLAGERLREAAPVANRLRQLFAAGLIATAAALLWGRAFPINKSLWTSSYALLMSGLACASLAACVWIVDVRGWKRWAAPLVWLGRNAIAAFTLSGLGAIALIAVKIAGPDGKPRSLWTAIYRTVFDRFTDPRLGSLLFALAYLGVWVALCGLLYRKHIFIKV